MSSPHPEAAPEPVRLMARTIRGIEWVAAAEIRGVLGAEPTAIEHREVRFEQGDLSPRLLTLGTVDDVFAVLCELDGVGRRRESLDTLRTRVADCDPGALLRALRRLRQIPQRPSFDVSATFVGKRNFNRFEIEDAAGSALAGTTGWRYETRSGGRRPPATDLSLRVHLTGERATVAIRVGERPLHRRPYRQESRTASLRPPLARALALLAGLAETVTLVDPFCGAGTIPIEAALAQPGVTCVGYDLDPGVIELARSNAQRAGVQVELEPADAAALPRDPGSVDRVATNPPWGEAVRPAAPLAGAWRALRPALAAEPRVALLGPDDLAAGAAAALPLERALRTPVSLLGQHVTITVLSPAGRLTAPGQLLERELEDAFDRYADAVPAQAGG